MKAMKVMKTMKAMKAKKPMKKPAAWVRLRPNGCSKCRNVRGCTLSCWASRGGPP